MESVDKQLYVSPIATPIATEKLTTKLLSLTTKCKFNNFKNNFSG